MTELNQTLPLLPLTSGVVLPGMVFTMALETDEARTAAEAAGSVGGELVLVPHIDGPLRLGRGHRQDPRDRASCPGAPSPWW